MKNKIFLLGVSLLLSFLAAEVFCRTVFGRRLVMHFEKNGLYYFKPDQNGWYLLHHPAARINNIGARGADIAWPERHGEGRFVFLGDSFTFGWLLPEGKTLPDYFREAAGLPEGRVLNLGNGGFGIDHMTALYRHHRRLFSKGDRVVMVFPEMDFNRPMEAKPLSPWRRLFWKIREKSSLISCTYFVLHRIYWKFKNRVENAIAPRYEPVPDKPVITIPFLEKRLLGFLDPLRQAGQGIVFVFYEFEKSAYSDMGERFCRKHHLACLTDVWRHAETLRARGEPVHAADGAHPSAAMNRAVGKAVARVVGRIKWDDHEDGDIVRR